MVPLTGGAHLNASLAVPVPLIVIGLTAQSAFGVEEEANPTAA
jgi:hypothetical protein